MAQLYRRSLVSAFGSGPSDERAVQRRVIKEMRDCVQPSAKDIAPCLQEQYDDRNRQLAAATVLGSPRLPLDILRRTDPPFAPVIEALTIWTTAPQDTDWTMPVRKVERRHILALLRPSFDLLFHGKSVYFSNGIPVGAPDDHTPPIRHLSDILNSERHFAAFLNVLGPFLKEGPEIAGRRALPCAAIHRHPALLGATASFFGATMDNFVFDTDCAQTLPPTPMLSALIKKLDAAWPPCSGTIRFAAYRTFGTAVDAARLGLAEQDHDPESPQPSGIVPADVDAARRELAAYYAVYLRQPPSTAEASARNAIKGVLSTAQECD